MAYLAPRLFAPLVTEPEAAAAGDLAGDRVEKALEELTPEKLRAALTKAIARVADHVSVKPAAVEKLLPMAEVDAALGRLATTQPRAVTAWRAFAGGLGGLLGRSSAIPGEGTAPAVSERLRALADTMQRDRVVSEPLHALAQDLAAWEALVAKLQQRIETAGELKLAYRLRQGKVAAVIAVIAAIVIVLAIVSRALLVARSNVTAAAAKEDPCAILEVSPVDLGRVSSELEKTAADRRAACEQKRADEAKRVEEERLRKEREEAARKAKEKLEADCEALATHVEAGKLTLEDQAFASDAGLTARIADGSLEGKDFGPDDPKMPCAGTKAQPRLWESFRKVVVAKPWIMLVANSPSPRVRAAFATDGGKMPFKMRKVIATRANDLSKFAIRSGKVEDAARASAWCEVARSVGMPMAGPCDLADKLAKPK